MRGETVNSTTKRAVLAVAALQPEIIKGDGCKKFLNYNAVATRQLMGW